jgi:hypothetical protein
MSVDLDRIAVALRQDRVFDSGRLKPGGRRELSSTIERWQRAYSLYAYVVLLGPDESSEGARALWGKLGLDNKRDLLLIANGRRWEARGWGLSARQVEQALTRAAPALEQ